MRSDGGPGVAAPSGARRFRQGLRALRPRIPGDRDAILAAALTPAQAAAFRGLLVHDQAHLLRVYRALLQVGVTDRDLLTAVLLHDLGKTSPAGHVRLPDRVARVVLGRVAPGALHRLARLPAPRWRLGLALAVHHAALGADRAALLGCSPRVRWLIAHHDHPAALHDADLALLAAADDACP